MARFIRFQTGLPSRLSGHRLGLFVATRELRNRYDVPNYYDELLQETLDWFNENLTVPRLTWRYGRPIFWFRDDAGECLVRIWNMIAVFNEDGLYVEHLTTVRPGHIVYRDEHQIAAIPGKR
jgi:hypothetical protein